MKRTYFEQKFTERLNCVQVSEFECKKCNLHWLTDARGVNQKCPGCGKPAEARGWYSINKKICTHNALAHNHEASR